MKIFFLGGSFDPPHIAHLKIAKSCLKYCDKFLFIPSKKVPHKQENPYFSSKDRVRMLDNDMIRLDQKINTIIEIHEQQKRKNKK